PVAGAGPGEAVNADVRSRSGGATSAARQAAEQAMAREQPGPAARGATGAGGPLGGGGGRRREDEEHERKVGYEDGGEELFGLDERTPPSVIGESPAEYRARRAYEEGR
ncbi:MAG: hypothetical protein ACRDQ5_21145, partial [Sciscionella sp.]